MSVMVTGAAGHIGSNIVRTLPEQPIVPPPTLSGRETTLATNQGSPISRRR
jgi:nucleoside-diphosphate-sugar epimerase